MTATKIKCTWCGKPNRTASAWEQNHHRHGWQRLCVACCNKRTGRSALLDVRRVPEPSMPASTD